MDIMYNEDKFLSGEINLCFVTGYMGSGKSTLAAQYDGDNVERISLDVISNNNLSEDDWEEYGELSHDYFQQSTVLTDNHEILDDDKCWHINCGFDSILIKDIIDFTKEYAAKHPEKKFIIEGVQILYMCTPEELDGYVVFIKDTPMIVSKYRAVKRDSRWYGRFIFRKDLSYYIEDSKKLRVFKKYFRERLK